MSAWFRPTWGGGAGDVVDLHAERRTVRRRLAERSGTPVSGSAGDDRGRGRRSRRRRGGTLRRGGPRGRSCRWWSSPAVVVGAAVVSTAVRSCGGWSSPPPPEQAAATARSAPARARRAEATDGGHRSHAQRRRRVAGPWAARRRSGRASARSAAPSASVRVNGARGRRATRCPAPTPLVNTQASPVPTPLGLRAAGDRRGVYAIDEHARRCRWLTCSPGLVDVGRAVSAGAVHAGCRRPTSTRRATAASSTRCRRPGSPSGRLTVVAERERSGRWCRLLGGARVQKRGCSCRGCAGDATAAVAEVEPPRRDRGSSVDEVAARMAWSPRVPTAPDEQRDVAATRRGRCPGCGRSGSDRPGRLPSTWKTTKRVRPPSTISSYTTSALVEPGLRAGRGWLSIFRTSRPGRRPGPDRQRKTGQRYCGTAAAAAVGAAWSSAGAVGRRRGRRPRSSSAVGRRRAPSVAAPSPCRRRVASPPQAVADARPRPGPTPAGGGRAVRVGLIAP